MVTFFANLYKAKVSSIAESPPPITTTPLFLNKAASQTAQVLTPRPKYLSSPGIFNLLADAPVAIITVLALYFVFSTPTSK